MKITFDNVMVDNYFRIDNGIYIKTSNEDDPDNNNAIFLSKNEFSLYADGKEYGKEISTTKIPCYIPKNTVASLTLCDVEEDDCK